MGGASSDRAGVLQAPDKIRRFIRRDSARNTENDVHGFVIPSEASGDSG
jgi:hypothetical protein